MDASFFLFRGLLVSVHFSAKELTLIVLPKKEPRPIVSTFGGFRVAEEVIGEEAGQGKGVGPLDLSHAAFDSLHQLVDQIRVARKRLAETIQVAQPRAKCRAWGQRGNCGQAKG